MHHSSSCLYFYRGKNDSSKSKPVVYYIITFENCELDSPRKHPKTKTLRGKRGCLFTNLNHLYLQSQYNLDIKDTPHDNQLYDNKNICK